jgi:hypothetical protein
MKYIVLIECEIEFALVMYVYVPKLQCHLEKPLERNDRILLTSHNDWPIW